MSSATIESRKSRKVTSKTLMANLEKPALLAGGYIIGKVIGKALDKNVTLTGIEDLTGFNVKTNVYPWVKGAAMSLAGTAGYIYFKESWMRYLSLGVGAAGLTELVEKKIMPSTVQGFLGIDPSFGDDEQMAAIDIAGLGLDDIGEEEMNGVEEIAGSEDGYGADDMGADDMGADDIYGFAGRRRNRRRAIAPVQYEAPTTAEEVIEGYGDINIA